MLRKFRVKINDKEYMVEMEEIGAQGNAVPSQPVESTFPNQPTPAPTAPVVSQPATPEPAPQQSAAQETGEGEAITSPMPGNILDVKVKVGDKVTENQVLAVLEAMKMENEIVAPKDGTITAVPATKGSAIDAGEVIVYIR